MPAIDTTFDVNTDATGPDPDNSSPTLKRYYRLLWSKPLPDGRELTLHESPQCGAPRGYYLYAVTDDGTEQTWSSDSIVATHTKTYADPLKILNQVPDSVKREFLTLACTIGGYVLWPGNPIEREWTINQARGCTDRISDRMDLTLECVRRYYLDPGDPSPLAETFGRYPEFFALFQDFRGYVDFWLLQDLVSPDCDRVSFFLPFDEFDTPVARNVDEWNTYRLNSIEFCNARNKRIERWAAEHPGS